MYIMVLADGETFTVLNNCFITRVPDSFSTDEIEEMLEEREDIFQVHFEESNGVIGIDIEKSIAFQLNVE